jgi:hypothetical protein
MINKLTPLMKGRIKTNKNIFRTRVLMVFSSWWFSSEYQTFKVTAK